MENQCQSLRTVFTRIPQRPYTHCDSVKYIEHPDMIVPSNKLVKVPENVRITIKLPRKMTISVYSPNILYQRLDVCCSVDKKFLHNHLTDKVSLHRGVGHLMIQSEQVDVVLSFSPLPDRIIPRELGKYILGGKMGEVVYVTKLKESHYIDCVMPEFVVDEYNISKIYRTTSIIPTIPRDILPNYISCSGDMYFDPSNRALWSQTTGKYTVAMGSDDRYWGLELPYTKCMIRYTVKLEVDGKIPTFIAYLKCKSDPNTYYIHKDINNQDCEEKFNSVKYSGEWTLTPQMFSNAILYVQLEGFSADDSNIIRSEYTLEIETSP